MVKRLIVASSYQSVKDVVPDYKYDEDMMVSTSVKGDSNRLMSMLPRGEWTYLVEGWKDGKYWEEVARRLSYRLMRSRESLSDCQTIGAEDPT